MGDKCPITRSYHYIVHAANGAGKPDDAGGASENRRIGIGRVDDAALAGAPPTWRFSKQFNNWCLHRRHDGTWNRVDAICACDTTNSDERNDSPKSNFTPRRLRTGAIEVAALPWCESATRDFR